MQRQILSITEINEYIRSGMENDLLLNQVAVRGEISNYKVYPSGHCYFTLKDESAALKCVCFKSQAAKLRFRPENGMKVIAIGKISVYPRDGVYQLYCNVMTVDGIGDLYAAFEQLKAKLMAEGLFEPAHKKPIPTFPDTIGIITSPAGAAIHDILRIIGKRFPIAKVRLLPVRVQGEEAPEEIAAAIRYANQYRLADLLIVGRGGGSIEDLWAFNDERVAHAIYDSEIPVISAVGHEPDVTISDYTADMRAATPSNAAELAVPDQAALRQTMDAAEFSMVSAMQRQLMDASRRLDVLKSASVLSSSPMEYLRQKQIELDHMRSRLTAAQIQELQKKSTRFISAAAKLDAMSPLKVLSRGYAIVRSEEGTILRSVQDTAPGQEIEITLSDGCVSASISKTKEGAN